ncbi:MAG: hypothetical protein HYW45_00135 [Candidatus Daviesbacteria bacterium]|nr:MAG: hypothetical protein HYW45_00135 [Candidatus Daviesbacteria bacterium]
MSYRSRIRSHSTRRSKQNFFATIIIALLLLFISINWILPALVSVMGKIRNLGNQTSKISSQVADNPTLAPPVFIIPYQATNSAQIDIKGYATTNSKVELYLDEELKDTVAVNEDGTFVFQNISLNLGLNNIYGKTLDEKDQASLPSKNIQLIYDNTKPSLQVNEPEDGKTVTGGEKNIKISGKTNPDAQVTVNEVTVIVDKEGNFSTSQALNEGDNNFTIRAGDAAGNYAEVVRRVSYKSS